LTEAKRDFDTIIERVKKGETFILTWGRWREPVAKLTLPREWKIRRLRHSTPWMTSDEKLRFVLTGNGNGALIAGGDHFVGFWTLRVVLGC
jgi:antitoxin (DNA-binding transcriptional repressor) of toxin-antitoxin stability system